MDVHRDVVHVLDHQIPDTCGVQPFCLVHGIVDDLLQGVPILRRTRKGMDTDHRDQTLGLQNVSGFSLSVRSIVANRVCLSVIC